MKIKSFIFAMAIALNGCATISNGSTQSIRVQTIDDTSQNTICTASNEEGQWDNIKVMEEVTVHRDGNPLTVQCNNEQQAGTGSAEPKFQTDYLFTDIFWLDACIISCIIDGSTNAFYNYPFLVKVPMESKKAELSMEGK